VARILIVEDSPEERALLSELLSMAGHEVCLAAHGREALRLLREKPVELAITDMLMPEMDGVETMLALRRDHPGVKIIAVSGGGVFGADHCLRLARNLGARRILEKPYTPEEMLNAVQCALGAD
jgi:CheY-like chemotaxis protein